MSQTPIMRPCNVQNRRIVQAITTRNHPTAAPRYACYIKTAVTADLRVSRINRITDWSTDRITAWITDWSTDRITAWSTKQIRDRNAPSLELHRR